jgi:hypothetical protein
MDVPVKAFIWTSVGKLTDHYHREGGLLVVAYSLDAARELIRTRSYPRNSFEGDVEREMIPADCEAHTTEPDTIFAVADDVTPEFWIFPDAGCC